MLKASSAQVARLDISGMSNQIADLGYANGHRIQVGNATSARSSCKQCRGGISKGDLRIGRLVGFASAGIGPKWCHPNCFGALIQDSFAKPVEWWQKYVPDLDDVPGYASLSVPDQDEVKNIVSDAKGEPNFIVTVEADDAAEDRWRCTTMAGKEFLLTAQASELDGLVAAKADVRRSAVKLVQPDGSLFSRKRKACAALAGA